MMFTAVKTCGHAVPTRLAIWSVVITRLGCSAIRFLHAIKRFKCSNIKWLKFVHSVSWETQHVNIIASSKLDCLNGPVRRMAIKYKYVVQALKEVWTEPKIEAIRSHYNETQFQQ